MTTTHNVPSLPTLFTTAAWLHARSFMKERAFVPDVMVLGRFSDEELVFVFPSSQDREAFTAACASEAASFGADIAMLIGESMWGDENEKGQPIVSLYIRERGKPVRAEMAFIAEATKDAPRGIGPVSSLPGEHEQEIIDAVWPQQLH